MTTVVKLVSHYFKLGALSDNPEKIVEYEDGLGAICNVDYYIAGIPGADRAGIQPTIRLVEHKPDWGTTTSEVYSISFEGPEVEYVGVLVPVEHALERTDGQRSLTAPGPRHLKRWLQTMGYEPDAKQKSWKLFSLYWKG